MSSEGFQALDAMHRSQALKHAPEGFSLSGGVLAGKVYAAKEKKKGSSTLWVGASLLYLGFPGRSGLTAWKARDIEMVIPSLRASPLCLQLNHKKGDGSE